MKKNFGIVLAIALGLSALLLTVAFQAGWVRASQSLEERSGAPTIVSYQGQVWDGTTPYDDYGYFKFAIVNSVNTIVWSNDGSTSEPVMAVELLVNNGFFSINLGDIDVGGMMQPILATTFTDPNTRLRVWFSPDGVGAFTQLPDQKIAAVPYALQSQYASDADKLDNKHGSAYQLRVSVVCPENYAFQEIDEWGDGVCVPIEHRPVYSLTTVGDDGRDSFVPSVAIGVDGLPLISFFSGEDATHGGLHVMHCRTLDCTLYDIFKIDTDSDYVGLLSTIVIGQDGLGLIAYADVTNNQLRVAHCANVSCSEADRISIVYSGAGGYSLYNLSAAIGVDGYPLIGFLVVKSAANDLLYVAHCNDVSCTSLSTPVQIYAADSIAYEISLTIGADGIGLLSFHNNTTGDLRTAHCGNVACTAMTGMSIASPNEGVDNSITRGNDGLGLIAYYSESASALKVAHCNNITCSSATSVIIDTIAGGIAGNWPAITIGSDGLGFIVYDAFDGSDQILKVAHCIDVTCSGAVTYVIDKMVKTSNAGIPSVTIGTDGMPIIAYYDGYSTDLKVMHCSNNFCLPYVRSH